MPFYRIRELKLPLDHGEAELRRAACKALGLGEGGLLSLDIERKSFDARDKRRILVVYAVRAETGRELGPRGTRRGLEPAAAPRPYSFAGPARRLPGRPVVIGSGPAGYFCALLLAEAGHRPLVLERGDPVEARAGSVRRFFGGGALDPESNIQFGEGGAGTFSDGKLTTSVTDEAGRNRKVLEELVAAGAPAEILYAGKPHIGTDYLIRVVGALRRKIESLGGEVRFRSRATSLLIAGGRVEGVEVNGAERIAARLVALAIGHSARDTFADLAAGGVGLERKAFAIGLRVEHPQSMVDRSQYGPSRGHPALPVADYRLATRSRDGRGVYSFCMCPGGSVVNSSSEPGSVVCNGMSDFARDGRNANSAIVVAVRPEDFGPGGALAGVDFQRRWERLAFAAGGSDMSLPVQTLGDFLAGRPSAALGDVEPSIAGPYRLSSLAGCLPDYVAAAIAEGLVEFDRRLEGFARPDAVLTGVETRTSSPVRILRGPDMQATVAGLYPCGEGSGYAGGIMSSAIDGIKAAEAIACANP